MTITQFLGKKKLRLIVSILKSCRAEIQTLEIIFQILHPENNTLLLLSHFITVHFRFFPHSLLFSCSLLCSFPFCLSLFLCLFSPTLFSPSLPYFLVISNSLSPIPFLTLFTLLIPYSLNLHHFPLISPCSSLYHLPGPEPICHFFISVFQTSVSLVWKWTPVLSTRQGKDMFKESLCHSAPIHKKFRL